MNHIKLLKLHSIQLSTWKDKVDYEDKCIVFFFFLFLIFGYLKIKMSFALILVEYRGLNFLA